MAADGLRVLLAIVGGGGKAPSSVTEGRSRSSAGSASAPSSWILAAFSRSSVVSASGGALVGKPWCVVLKNERNQPSDARVSSHLLKSSLQHRPDALPLATHVTIALSLLDVSKFRRSKEDVHCERPIVSGSIHTNYTFATPRALVGYEASNGIAQSCP